MLIKTLLTGVLKAIKVDYVVEQGTSNNWSYKKWNSGKMEAYRRIQYSSISFTSSTGGGYKQPEEKINLPTGFVSIPIVITIPQSGYYMSTNVANVTTTNFNLNFSRHFSNTTLSSYYIGMVAYGSWK